MTVYDIAARLPSIDVMRERCKALAMLDAIAGGDYFAYDREWGDGEAASMRNGSGGCWRSSATTSSRSTSSTPGMFTR